MNNRPENDPVNWHRPAALALCIGLDIGLAQDHSAIVVAGAWRSGTHPHCSHKSPLYRCNAQAFAGLGQIFPSGFGDKYLYLVLINHFRLKEPLNKYRHSQNF
jgi:hypothetical protein